jgi:outer membrane protein, multidrug efflux system
MTNADARVSTRVRVAHGLRVIAMATALAAATGCASIDSLRTNTPLADPAPALQTPAQWYAPMQASPHSGQTQQLSQWWASLGDTVLVDLLSAAQVNSASVAQAASRIAQSRAALTLAGGAARPTLGVQAGFSRAATSPAQPAATVLQGGLQAAWEIDVFGAAAANTQAASIRLDAAQAQWHDARVSVAAELAAQYFSLRLCQAQTELLATDAVSRAETARLATLTAKAGFTAPAVSALARASKADAANTLSAKKAECELTIKALVALTAMPEPDLKTKLANVTVKWSDPAIELVVAGAPSAIPANVLMQRPDLAAAQREVAAAAADLRMADARRYPVVSLSGSIGGMRVDSGGASSSGATWSLGPIAVSLPILDNGRTQANIDVAKASYSASVALLQSKARQAVREVEEALVQLDNTAARAPDVAAASAGYGASLAAAQARYQAGVGSLVELEDARRTALFAKSTELQLLRERIVAWISLYRAVGGGWSPAS